MIKIRKFKDPVKKILGVYSGEPTWENYNFDSKETAKIEKYWSTAKLGGGPVFLDLDTENKNNIKSPFLNDISTTPNFGFYGIRKI